MRHQRGIVLVLLALVVAFSLACGLTGSQKNGSTSEGKDSSSSSSGGDEVLDQFSTDIQTPLYRQDKKNFNAEQFLARPVPVDIQFSGDAAPEVIMKGALAIPNYYISANPPEKLHIFFVMKKIQTTFLHMDISPMVYYSDMEWTIDLLDASGLILQSVQYRPESVFPNYPQSISAYLDQIPGGVARISISAVVTQRSIGITCFTDADINFQFPYDVFPHSPIQIRYALDDMTLGAAPSENVVGQLRMHIKNIHNVGLIETLKIFFLDEGNNLVGWAEWNGFMEANEIEEMWDLDYLTTSYLSTIPNSALVVFEDVEICNLIEASR
jgi:hypothetical protein